MGLGYIAQGAVLPAFQNASKNSELVALVSDDATKLKFLKEKYKVPLTYTYDEYDDCLRSGEIDAVYIALPNDMHKEYAIRAARAGIHILCEKPLALTEEDCKAMIGSAAEARVKLMTAYRLHYDEANMKVAELVRSGKIGEPRIFNSFFTMQVTDPDNIRLKRSRGGGTLYDLGIYCINASRYIFRAEPFEVFAYTANNGNKRFSEIDEMTSAVLRFPDERLATFTSSFGAADVSSYRVVGTKGDIRVEPAFEYAEPLRYYLTIGEKTTERAFTKRDQFAPELLHFSEAIIRNKDPEPSGKEGMADVRIIEALYRSAEIGRPVKLGEFERLRRPDHRQATYAPPVKRPDLIHTQPPHST